MQKKLGKKDGFSLLELLLYITIISIVTLIVAGTFVSFNRGRGQVETKSEVDSAMNFAIEKISQDVRSATAVTVPATAGTSADNLALTISGTTVNYCLVSGQVRKGSSGTCDASSEAITGNTVNFSSAAFTKIENTNSLLSKTVTSIEINFSANYNSSSPDWQYSTNRKTSVSLR